MGKSEVRYKFKHQPASPGAWRARSPVLADRPRRQEAKARLGLPPPNKSGF